MIDYIVTAWNNKSHSETAYITDKAGAKEYAAYLRRYPKVYSNIKITERNETA